MTRTVSVSDIGGYFACQTAGSSDIGTCADTVRFHIYPVADRLHSAPTPRCYCNTTLPMPHLVKSMTGFAAVTGEVTGGRIAVELKSVNHRYLEFQTRMAEEIRSLESAMREQLAATLTRGKVDCRVTLTSDAAQSTGVLDDTALSVLAEAQQTILARFQARPLSVWEIMHSPGVVAASEMTAETIKDALLALFARAVVELDATRVREGEKLATMILERLDAIDRITATIAPLVPQMVSAYEDKLRQKIADADLNAASDERLKQEVVLFASRVDVAEELNRLAAHTSEVRRVLKSGGAIGKRLDFLMQELNREANTLGSKSVSTESTRVSIELKVLIEQMREQIQNIE
jgi:uncharacterized protein (TIGR00255 family)